jgi:hypothetical protein
MAVVSRFFRAPQAHFKSHARVRPVDLRGLRAFLADYPPAHATLLYGGRERLAEGGVQCQSVDAFLRELRPDRVLPM